MKRNSIVIGEGERCSRCSHKMERRTHKKIKNKQRKAAYYFSEWDYCTNCEVIKIYEKYKVKNRRKAHITLSENYNNLREEYQQKLDFFKNI